MALTFANVPAGGSLQLDDGSHASVYVQNVGNRHCVIEPGGYTLSAGQIGTFFCVNGTPLTAASNRTTTLAYQVSRALSVAAPSGALALTDVADVTTTGGAVVVGKHNPVDATAGSVQMTLTDAAQAGLQVSIEKSDNSVNVVGITMNLRGVSLTYNLLFQRETLFAVSKADGSWWPVASHRTKAALDAVYALPTQTGQSGKVLTTNGTATSWGAAAASLPVRSVSVAYSATITPNADTTDVLNIATMTGNLTLANPTGTPIDGQMLRLRLQQDATGGRTITFGAGYAFGTDVTTALIPTTASAKYVLLFSWDATTSKWRALAIARGF